MPRSIAEVNANRGSNPNPSAEGNLPGDGQDGFDPNQPRVPAGHSKGGQWTKTVAHGPASSRREVELDESGEEAWECLQRYVDVQDFTDGTAAGARRERNDWTPTGFGTEVHKRVAREVNGKVPGTDDFRRPAEPEDPDFRAEFSALKTKAADPNAPPPRYGQKGTIRVDVLENPTWGQAKAPKPSASRCIEMRCHNVSDSPKPGRGNA